jgi:hypothetical protein
MIPFRLAPYIIVNLRGGSWFRNLAALSEGWNFVPSEEGINLRTNAPHRRTDAGGVISELRGTLAGDMPADDFGRCRRRDRPRHRTAEQGDELASPHSRRQGGKRFGSSTARRHVRRSSRWRTGNPSAACRPPRRGHQPALVDLGLQVDIGHNRKMSRASRIGDDHRSEYTLP